MSSKSTLLCPKWLIPVQPSQTVLTEHAVLIEKETIKAVGKRERLIEQHPNADVVQLPDHALIPGLINAHGHSAMTLLRGIADDLPLETWLHDHIWPAEAKWVNEQFVEDGTKLAVAEMLLGGTTCFADMYFYPNISARVAQNMGIRAMVGLIVMDFPTVWAQNPDEYFTKGIEVHDEIRSYSNVSASFAPHAPYTVSDEPLQRVQTLADELQLQIQMHIHETEHEVKEAIGQTGQSPLRRLDDLGLLTPKLMAVHMTQLDASEIELVARSGMHVIHCPESNMKLASGICPVSDLLSAGANVALGTDGAASNNDLSMLGEMRTASMLAKVSSKDAAALPAWQVLEMATINGAKALNMEHEVGSIEVGKFADLTAIELASVHSTPVYDPISTIIYSCSPEQVTDVWVGGKRVVNSRVLVDTKIADLKLKARDWADRISRTT